MNKNNQSVTVLPGAEGVKAAYRQALGADRIDIVCLSQNYTQVVGDFFDKEVSPKLYSDMVITREILPDNPENRLYAKGKNQEKHAVRFLKSNEISESDMMILEERVILVSFHKTNPFAVVITDPELVTSFQVQFNSLFSGSV